MPGPSDEQIRLFVDRITPFIEGLPAPDGEKKAYRNRVHLLHNNLIYNAEPLPVEAEIPDEDERRLRLFIQLATHAKAQSNHPICADLYFMTIPLLDFDYSYDGDDEDGLEEIERRYHERAELLETLKGLLVNDSVMALVEERWGLTPYEVDVFAPAIEYQVDVEHWLEEYNDWYDQNRA